MKIKLTETEFDLLYRQGGRRVAPGFWIDRFGDGHVSVPELLALFDLEDTPTNRESVAATVRQMLAELSGPEWVITTERTPEPTGGTER